MATTPEGRGCADSYQLPEEPPPPKLPPPPENPPPPEKPPPLKNPEPPPPVKIHPLDPPLLPMRPPVPLCAFCNIAASKKPRTPPPTPARRSGSKLSPATAEER